MLPETVTDFLPINSNKKFPSHEGMLGSQYQLNCSGYGKNIGKGLIGTFLIGLTRKAKRKEFTSPTQEEI